MQKKLQQPISYILWISYEFRMNFVWKLMRRQMQNRSNLQISQFDLAMQRLWRRFAKICRNLRREMLHFWTARYNSDERMLFWILHRTALKKIRLHTYRFKKVLASYLHFNIIVRCSVAKSLHEWGAHVAAGGWSWMSAAADLKLAPAHTCCTNCWASWRAPAIGTLKLYGDGFNHKCKTF